MKEIIDITPLTDEEAMLGILKKAVEENERKLYVLDAVRYNEMQKALRTISKIVLENDPDAKIESGFCEMFRGDGRITIETTDIGANAFEMPDFREVMNIATTFDVLPLKNGKRIRCGMTFADVMRKRT